MTTLSSSGKKCSLPIFYNVAHVNWKPAIQCMSALPKSGPTLLVNSLLIVPAGMQCLALDAMKCGTKSAAAETISALPAEC